MSNCIHIKLYVFSYTIFWSAHSVLSIQGQCRYRPGTCKGQAGTGCLSGQFKKGADEGGLTRAHTRAKGELQLLITPSNGIDKYETIWQYMNLYYRTKRSRSWLRSVMSWSLKWGRVSDCTATRPDLKVRTITWCVLRIFTKRLMGVQDQIGLRYFSCWLCVQRSHRNGFLIKALYIFDVSVSEFCLKVFNIISLMCVWVRVWKKNIVKLSIMMLLLPWQPLREKTVYLLLLLSPHSVRESHKCR